MTQAVEKKESFSRALWMQGGVRSQLNEQTSVLGNARESFKVRITPADDLPLR